MIYLMLSSHLYLGQRYICEVEGCGKTYTTAISLRGHMAQHAGFSKICSYCGKTYKNPYGHKCKASREGKRKLTSDPNTGKDLGGFFFTLILS